MPENKKEAVRVARRRSSSPSAIASVREELVDPKLTEHLLDDRVREPLATLDLERSGLAVELSDDHVAAVLHERALAATKVFSMLDTFGTQLKDFFPAVPETLPPEIRGRLVNPDGTAAANVSVRALEPTPASEPDRPWPNPESVTDRRGGFRLTLPARPIDDRGMRLLVTGADRALEVVLRRTDLIAGNGDLGVLPLDQSVEPLATSALARLGDVVVPTGEHDVLEHPSEYAMPAPVITLGEGDCAMAFRSNSGVIDRFSYSLLVRLIEPQLSHRRLGARFTLDRGKGAILSASTSGIGTYVGVDELVAAMTRLGRWEIVERVPVETPIDVDGFLDLVERDPKRVPKAASLGLGYVVDMRQIWIPTGMSLGDLVYSLPLAPGEQQRIAVSDERETLTVREAETMTAQERQRFDEVADSSTDAVFRSAFDEAASGGSSMRTSSSAGAIGGGLGVGGLFGKIVAGIGVAGGYASSTTTGNTSTWQSTSRDYVSSASQDFHSSLTRQAAARREASRTSVRLASATERREVVTKVITNNNRNHALTMQYWQVLRHFGVTSTVDDVQLVCFVPLEIVQFLPASHPRTLPTGEYPRNYLLHRYAALLRHHDVVASRVRRNAELRHGLRVLRAFAGNPTMTVQGSSGNAQDMVDVSVDGTFMPFEQVTATIVSTTGARVGPVRLDGTSASVPSGLETRAALLQALRDRRATGFERRSATIALPEHVARSDLARLELRRSFSTFAYRLSLPANLSFSDLLSYLRNQSNLDVTLTPADLERELGGPLVRDPEASIGSVDLVEEGEGTRIMGGVLPVAAKRLPPVLAFADLLRIEAVLQHVVQNTVEYSKAVWQALSPEERAIMLEPYTIGVPSGGLPDAADEVPLLNCVANTVLGYFGNAAIMPFFIPPLAAERIGRTSRDIQEALLRFHRQAYAPAQSSITLPARGVLGEAVLGHCESSEKIDLTRFWNWQDSPIDQATDPAQLAELFGGGNRLVGSEGASVPSGLQTGPAVTINQGPTALQPSDLAAKLVGSAPSGATPGDMTGIGQLGAQMKVQTETTAESLNKTIAEASGLAKKAMESLPHVVAAKQAAAAGKDKNDKDGKDGKDKDDKDEDGTDDADDTEEPGDGG